MGILTLCLLALALYVWYLASKVSDLEKTIKDLKESTGENAEQKDKIIKAEIYSEKEASKPEAEQSGAPNIPVAAKINETAIKTSLQMPPDEADVPQSKTVPSDASQEPKKDKTSKAVNWELFTGVKLFAWIGGFAAFLGIIFLTKFAIDNNMISPLIRVLFGFGAGIALVCAGVLTKSEKLKTTGNVLSAIGIVFVYVSAFAAGSFYNIFSLLTTFAVMIAASAGAFIISVRKNAKYIAVLAAIGGYLTPILLSSGSGAIVSLSAYMAVLTVTIMMISVKKEWKFLIWLSAAGVYLILSALCVNDFVDLRKYDMAAIFSGFCLLFTSFALVVSKKYKFTKKAYVLAPFLFNIFSMFFVFMFFETGSFLPPALLCIINACLLFIFMNDKYFKNGYVFASGISFIILFIWTVFYLKQPLLWTALGTYFIFFLLNAVLPLLDSFRKKETPSQWYGFLSAAFLFVMAVCAIKASFVYFSFWILIALIAFFALAFSEITKNVFTGLFSVFGIFANIFVWLLSTRSYAFSEINFAVVACGFGLCIFLLAVALKKKGAVLARSFNVDFQENASQPLFSVYNIFFISVFFLLSCAIIKVKPDLPDIFIVSGLIVSLFIIILSVINASKNFTGIFAALISMFLMQLLWQSFYYTSGVFAIVFMWYFIVFVFFFGAVFLLEKRLRNTKMPWLVAAVAGVLQCCLMYFAACDNPAVSPYLGAIPAFFAVIYGLATLCILRMGDMKDEFQKSRVGIFAAASLFFVTLIFPMQFQTQWLIVAWAIEAAALIGLFKLVPYKPLKYWGFWLSIIVFLKIVIPDTTLFTVTAGSIFNWYLYMYSIVIVSLISGALLWLPKGEKYAGINNKNVLSFMAVILLFVLLNTEIAAFFATGKYMHFSFDNSLAQDMAYTLCWGLFAVGMFVFGIMKKIKAVRISGLVLLLVAAFKLFMHDLWNLGQLYRIGSFFGLAAMLILVSYLYQKYIGRVNDDK